MKKLLLILFFPSACFAGMAQFQGGGTGTAIFIGSAGGGSGGSSVYPATATVSSPFGISASTGIFTSTITAQSLLSGTTIQVLRLQRNMSSNERFDFSPSGINMTVGGIQNTAFGAANFYGNTMANNSISGQTIASVNADGPDGEFLFQVRTTPSIQSLFPNAGFAAAVNDSNVDGTNLVYFGDQSIPGQDTYFFVAGGTNVSCGVNCSYETPSTTTFIIDGAYGSSRYGFVGIGISTPTSQLVVAGTTTVANLSLSSGSAIVQIATTSAVIVGACGASPSIRGGNFIGEVTFGTGAGLTSCTITFTNPSGFSSPPICFYSTKSASVNGPSTYSTTTSALTFSGTSLASDVIDYQCYDVRSSQ